jgi:hypothetical protein
MFVRVGASLLQVSDRQANPRTDDIWEIGWASDGRATFRYGAEFMPSAPRNSWLRVGTHAVLDDPGA